MSIKLQDVYNFLAANYKLIDHIKITRMEAHDFNVMEGYQWDINIKLFTIDGYRNKLIKVHTNSSYVGEFRYYDDCDDEQLKENILEWLNSALDAGDYKEAII